MTSLVSENGPSVTVILPLASRTRTPSLLGSRPPVSTSVPFLNDSSTNLPIASIKAGGGGDSRYDSEWRMNVRYFMAPPWGSDHATSEPRLDRQARNFFLPLDVGRRRVPLIHALAHRAGECTRGTCEWSWISPLAIRRKTRWQGSWPACPCSQRGRRTPSNHARPRCPFGGHAGVRRRADLDVVVPL